MIVTCGVLDAPRAMSPALQYVRRMRTPSEWTTSGMVDFVARTSPRPPLRPSCLSFTPHVDTPSSMLCLWHVAEKQQTRPAHISPEGVVFASVRPARRNDPRLFSPLQSASTGSLNLSTADEISAGSTRTLVNYSTPPRSPSVAVLPELPPEHITSSPFKVGLGVGELSSPPSMNNGASPSVAPGPTSRVHNARVLPRVMPRSAMPTDSTRAKIRRSRAIDVTIYEKRSR